MTNTPAPAADPPPPSERALPVPSALRPWFTGIGAVTVDGPFDDAFAHVPDTKLVVREEGDGRRDTLVVGPRTRASYHTDLHARSVSCVQLRLGPGMVGPLFGVPAVELVGRVVPLGELPAGTARRLARELTGIEREAVTARLAELLPPAGDGSRDRVLRDAVDALSTRPHRAAAPVREVARELAVSDRQLRNLFADGVGVSPKHFARIDRLRHVLTHAASAPWAELAAATGYYDQSHMTADFRTLMGVPPRAFFTGRLPRATPCRALPRR
ncbi:AraC-like DNA-binding protein [Streptomyces sp. 3330]|uniref:AraC family transcriptional regulator n=1 Tax=Streptomyces sp. 3330 TaxID=2817755 RepID=UPI00285DCF91|nr:helix-turn-helix domain-containing protein [Streptomyces sp. 3330]MDR6977759.1 AraC-like DNA-binding protein [Streptomyces sp. 3330]